MIEKTTEAPAPSHPRERLYDELLGYIRLAIDPKIVKVKSATEIPDSLDRLGRHLHRVTYLAEE